MNATSCDFPAGLSAWRGDITTLGVDAIVNAANSSLLGGGGVDGAIHGAAGPDLHRYCQGLGLCPAGEARLSPGFALPAAHVIHAVGPIWHGGTRGEAAVLERCYEAVFAIAAAQGFHTLAIPAISCGAYGFPHATAARIAVASARRALDRLPTLNTVLLVAFDAGMFELLDAQIEASTTGPSGRQA